LRGRYPTLVQYDILLYLSGAAAGLFVNPFLVRRFKGYASHSSLLNTSHMKKREFSETIESLLEREAVTCESGQKGVNNKVPKMYRVDPDILKSWSNDITDQVTVLRPEIDSVTNSPDSQDT